jgi:single-strand DNA-binding protein
MLVQAAVEMNLGTAPELRFTPAGKAVCSFRAVTSRRFLNKDKNEWEDRDTTWYEVTAWEKLAENIAESDLQVGAKVIVLGKVSNREWEGNDGEKKYTLSITADAIGPSLAFATAVVTKNPKTGSGSHGGNSGNQGGGSWNQAGPAEDPWAQPAQTDEPPF